MNKTQTTPEELIEETRKTCRGIPKDAKTSPEGLNRFQKTLKNLGKWADEKLDNYGLPMAIGAGSLVMTTDALRLVAEYTGQAPTLETTLYPAAGLAAITTALLSIPWKNHQKEKQKNPSPRTSQPSTPQL